MTLSANIEWCPKKGVWMPQGNCAGGDRYRRTGMDGVKAFTDATAGSERGLCVQAGGHVGFWPQFLAHRYAQVLTFEPHPANFRCLSANVSAANVYPYRAALGSETIMGQARLDEHADNTGGHHIVPNGGDSDGDPVQQIAVDDLCLPRLDALILDTEGAELLAIHGATHAIRAHRPFILVEERGHIEKKTKTGTTDELHELLAHLGYAAGEWLGHDRLWEPI